ncbi:MAG: pantoate--beta-alanine ligase [Bacteroidales bacterium]
MEVFHTIAQMQHFSLNCRSQGKSLGFVPTMGALHQGHLELVRRALSENDVVVCSIFVNPIQFNNPEDLQKYPRTFETDASMLQQLGCDAIFYPSVQEMYPEPEHRVFDFGQLDKVMEGEFRPGHFNGVAIVVKKLFEIVLPHRAYFGEKDFQQLAIIRALVKMEAMDLEIVPCSIVREEDGLAMSSRNVRLSAEERRQAPLIYKTLLTARELYRHAEPAEVIRRVEDMINSCPSMQLEYFNIAHMDSLQSIGTTKPAEPVVACIAVYMGEVRLIDNMIFNL